MSRESHIFHSFINIENSGKEPRNPDGTSTRDWSLYEWKHALDFLEYGHLRIKQAFEGALPDSHQQCSLSPVEPVVDNELRCCLGEDVVKCPIIQRLKAEFERHWNLPRLASGYDPGAHYRKEVTAEDLYKTAAKVCAWHIYEEQRATMIDSSEGYHLDGGDRRFWKNLYANMAEPKLEPLGEVGGSKRPKLCECGREWSDCAARDGEKHGDRR